MEPHTPLSYRVSFWIFAVLGAIGSVGLLIFLPLILSLIEYLLFGSDNVQQWFRAIGLHDELGRIYAPFGRLIADVLNI